MVQPRWQNQEEALQFTLGHPFTMLNMDMGTGKTRVAIDSVFERADIHRVLIVCPKSVLVDKVWYTNLVKFHPVQDWVYCGLDKGTAKAKAQALSSWPDNDKVFVAVNYDSCWRAELGDALRRVGFDLIILDESHRAKSAGSKVSKFLYLLGKRTPYKMCLSGTPMANSPLDVYGQYRFLDPSIFGTRFDVFKDQYAVLAGPERRFVVGFKNLNELDAKFDSIAYTCKMVDIADRLKLPQVLPPTIRHVEIPAADRRTLDALERDFIAECGTGTVVVQNILGKILRQQQITSGFCTVVDGPGEEPREEQLNNAKGERLLEEFEDISPRAPVVVFCVFRHDLDIVAACAKKAKRDIFEVSGRVKQLDEWRAKAETGAVLAVQIQAGNEGIDLTLANHAIYFSLPHSLAQYEQSKARLYRPGQERPVNFVHYVVPDSIDALMYESLVRKRNLIDDIQNGQVDFGYLKGGK